MNLLTLVGLGPGGPGGLTADARAALEGADLFCGYTGYIDLILSLIHIWPRQGVKPATSPSFSRAWAS